MVLDSNEVQVARATIANYESFCIAVWLWNYASSETLNDMKLISSRIKSTEGSIFSKLGDLSSKLPSPTDKRFQAIIESVGSNFGPNPSSLSQELITKYKL